MVATEAREAGRADTVAREAREAALVDWAGRVAAGEVEVGVVVAVARVEGVEEVWEVMAVAARVGKDGTRMACEPTASSYRGSPLRSSATCRWCRGIL